MQKDTMHNSCTVYRTADFMGKRWTIPLLLELHKGRSTWKRYSLIKSRLPDITPKVLSARLKELAREGMVLRRTDATNFPVKCEYRLSKSGEGFIGIIKSMKKWALRWKIRNKACESADCKNCEL